MEQSKEIVSQINNLKLVLQKTIGVVEEQGAALKAVTSQLEELYFSFQEMARQLQRMSKKGGE